MIDITLTLDREIINLLLRSVFQSNRIDISLVYFNKLNSFYFFPSNKFTPSLTNENGFLTPINCNVLSVRDEVSKLLDEPDVHSEPFIWEIETFPLLKFKTTEAASDKFFDIKEFLESLLQSSRFFFNSEIFSFSNNDAKSKHLIFLYSDEKFFIKVTSEKHLDLGDNTNKTQARTLLWLGQDNFQKINSFKIGCVGSGGLMNPFIIQAMHHGFKNFIIIDHDRLEEHNLNRFLGGKHSDVGTYKTDVIKRILSEYDSTINIESAISSFPDDQTQSLLSSCDMIVCGVDNDYTRVNVQLLALALSKPLLDMGSGIFLHNNTSLNPTIDERGGQIRLSIPDRGCLVCMGLNLAFVKDFKRDDFDIQRGYIVGTDLTPPSIITLNSTIASMALKMLVDYITDTGISKRHIKYNEKDLKLYHVLVNKNENCPVCG
jgi:molybdopterin/thiamine biosynthesis adenylyltransferase